MIKKMIIALCYGFTAIAQAELVTDKQGHQISNNNLEVLLETAPVDAQKKLLNNKAQLNEQLEQLYLRKVVAEMAVNEGLDKQGLNVERLEAVRNNALFALKLDALRKSNNKDYTKYAQQLYFANQADYPVAARVDAAHILISTKKLSDAEALAKAGEIRQQLMQGANFNELALKESDDKTAKNNKGELGVFTSKQMVKPFSDVVFAMQVGEISEPVKTKYGYHLIKLNKIMPAGVKPFDEVKADIINKLKEKDWVTARTAFFAQIVKENEMQIKELAVDEFVVKKLDELESKATIK
ncbi:peptidylprolyl isomerase [Methyloprofundus sedimenti]|nr:peptidylprolyl isomerase [Methyloprofundus sedimenti]